MIATHNTSCRPRLFIYVLPDTYRHVGKITAGSFEGGTWLNSGDTFRAFGLPYTFSGINMYDNGRLYYERALKYHCRVHDPAIADLFYVPAHNTEQQFRPSSFCAEHPRGAASHFDALYLRLEAQAPGALSAFGGADHFVIGTRIGAQRYETNPFCELNLADPRLGNAARLSIEQRAVDEDLPPRGPFTYTSSPEYISVPYPSWVRMPAKRPLNASSEFSYPWQDTHPRSILVAACFGTRAFHVRGPTGSVMHPLASLRGNLHRQCLRGESNGSLAVLPDGLTSWCVFLKPNATKAFASAAAKLYWDSVFCLMPSGDSATRKATIDALLLGCIPVVFHRTQLNQWLWHWGSWVANASVFIEAGQVVANITDVIAVLGSLPAERVKAMQQILAENAHRMHYTLTGDDSSARPGASTQEDAFDVAMSALYARRVDSSLVAKGKAMQQRAHERIAPAFNTFRSLNESVHAQDGQCKGSTGAYGTRAACSSNSSEWLPIHTLRPLIREHISSPEACEKLCRRCARCNYVSYSWMLRVCTWQEACNMSRLEKRWELWTFRTWRVTKTEGLIKSQ